MPDPSRRTNVKPPAQAARPPQDAGTRSEPGREPDVEAIPDEGTPELPDPEALRVDRSIPVDDVAAQPAGMEEVRDLDTTIGAASSGVLLDVDVEQARQRLHDVQVILIELGYFADRDSGRDVADGVWGPETRDAVAAFQADHDLDASGQVDSDTYEALLAEHELALGTRAPGEDVEEDAFAPLRPDKPLSD